MSVPTFYTEQRKKDFGYDQGSNDVSLIPVHLLIKHGFLTEDFQPTRSKRIYANSSKDVSDSEHRAETETLQRVIEEQQTRIRILEVLVEEKEKQLEMVNALIAGFGDSRQRQFAVLL